MAYVHGDSIQANYEFIAERERALFVAVQQAQMAVERMATPLQEEAQEAIAYASGPKVAEDEVQIAQSRLYEIEAQRPRFRMNRKHAWCSWKTNSKRK